jgi:hypothetical protein
VSTYTGTLPTAADGQKILGADITQLINALHALADSWTSYTPTWTGVPGTSTGAYLQIGKTVIFQAAIALTGAVTAAVSVTLPVTAVAAGGWAATVYLHDASATGATAGRQPGIGNPASGTGLDIYSVAGRVNATVPFTWTSTDAIWVSGTFQAA